MSENKINHEKRMVDGLIVTFITVVILIYLYESLHVGLTGHDA